jgi:hypothetical protein
MKKMHNCTGGDIARFLVVFVFFSLSTGKLYSQVYNTDFTLSDGAQNHQIGFDGLGFLSGNFCACSFVPPGKVADYFGFQYLRDNDITGMGHNSDFSSIIGNNMLFVLDSTQKALIVQTAKDQVAIIQQYAYMRFPLIDAFVRMRDNNMPIGSPGLDQEAVKNYSAQLYRVDGRVCIQRAKVYASILNSLTAKQKHYIDSIAVLGAKNMPVLPEQIDKKVFKITDNNTFVGVMSIADDLFSWYVGNVDADVYFCPERQANYFGSFYLKDAPAMGNPNYSIDTSLSQSGGSRFLATLTPAQASLINILTETQRTDMGLIVERRTDISKLLRGYLTNTAVDTSTVLSLSETYGRLDGEVSYYYAKNFSKVNWTLTTAQKDTMMKIRNLDDYPCNGAYLYSDPISMPTIQNTDFLFLPASTSTITVSTSINIANSGTITGTDTYVPGDIIIVTAKPNKGYTFTNWTENGTEVSKSNSYQFSASTSRILVANFALASYTMAASVLPANSGTVSGTGNYNYNTEVTLTTTPSTGYSFLNWTENGTSVSTNATYAFKSTTNRTLVANFKINSYSIAASVLPANAGTITGTGNYDYGSNVALWATAKSGYKFLNWTESNSPVSTNANYSFTVSANRSLVANFQLATGIQDLNYEDEIIVYPNPAYNILNIKGTTGEISVSITNGNGKTILNQKDNSSQIDITTLSKGLYILKITSHSGSTTKLFVKQ